VTRQRTRPPPPAPTAAPPYTSLNGPGGQPDTAPGPRRQGRGPARGGRGERGATEASGGASGGGAGLLRADLPDPLVLAGAPIPVGGLGVVLAALASGGKLGGVVEREHRLALPQHLLDLLIDLAALVLIQGLPTVVEELIRLRAGVLGEVEAGIGVVQ